MIHFVLLVVCAVAIYLSCEWFVNAVEWLGRRLNVGQVAVGTILAAFGTALPESVVTFVAVVFGSSPEQKDIGVGAAMGGPLVLSTVAYAATGAMLLVARRKRQIPAGDASGTSGKREVGTPQDMARLARDQRWFLAVFVVKVSLGLVAFAFKPWLGLLFFATYAVYFWREMRGGDDGDQELEVKLEPLKLRPRTDPPETWAVLAQTLVTLVIIFLASQVFVKQLDAIGPLLGLPAAVTALLLSPIATELPEIMNAIIWVRQGKARLALANISGAMMIQATVPSGLGLLFTPWRFDASLIWSAVITMAGIVYLLTLMRARKLTPGRLASAGVLYLVFVAGLLPILR
ncbi:MAG: sodium/calcium exchanger rane region [Streptosporangiaceae bacterium]|jgi:cation:H+ antiporter|nr:sodium/calcium exchanger rane region [Streptosporangiaceae bacterium]